MTEVSLTVVANKIALVIVWLERAAQCEFDETAIQVYGQVVDQINDVSQELNFSLEEMFSPAITETCAAGYAMEICTALAKQDKSAMSGVLYSARLFCFAKIAEHQKGAA